ncbi:hypothetical protein Tco_0481180 [Tanacetum coccineum]
MESLVHRVQHGNNKRADEAKLYHEIRNVNDTIIEIHTEPQEPDDDPWEMYYPWRRNIDKGYKQRQLKIVLSQVEKARSIRKGQLIHKLDLLRKNIKSMERELEKISSLRKKAYKCAYKHGAQQNEANQMEEPKEMSNNKKAQQLDVYNIASPRQHVKKDIAEKLYQVLSFSESSIIQDIDKCKKDEIRISNDIMWFSSCDKRREWKQQHIKNVEKDLRKTVNHELPMTSIDGFFWLTTEKKTEKFAMRPPFPRIQPTANRKKSSYTEYQWLITYVKELARRGDTDELMKVCHMQLFEGCSI